jgi:hypothetical protein
MFIYTHTHKTTKNTHTEMFTATLSIIAKNWNRSIFSSVGKWLGKLVPWNTTEENYALMPAIT